MNVADLFGIGGSWSEAFKSSGSLSSARGTIVPDGPIQATTLAVHSASSTKADIDALRNRFNDASNGLRTALQGFERSSQAVYTSSWTTTMLAASTDGVAARVSPGDVGKQVLTTTLAVNRQTSTARSSSSAIGLDITSPQAASRLTSSALGLDVTSAESVSSTGSTSELNTGTTPTNASNTLTFSNGTSVGTLSGTYKGLNGAAAATSLTVQMKSNSTLSTLLPANAKFDVKDQNGTVLFSYNGNVTAGQAISLGSDIGLSVSFSAGTTKNNATGSTAIIATPTTVNLDAAFNAGAAQPQFDAGKQVTAGSFTVNGTQIAVAANDTVNTVLSKINGSGAGVTASASGDKVSLKTTSASEDQIVLGNDTSGFLAATKLSAATTVTGNVRDDQQVLAKTTQFGSVASGSFTINGTSIAIDRNTDTLTSVIGKINNSAAGVTATYNTQTDKIDLVSTSNSEELTVGNDTTGFLAKAGLNSANTVRGNVRDDQQVLSKTTQFAGVSSGSFSVNGVSIAVDRSTDSLSSVVDRINNAGAGVTAAYDSATDKLVFTPGAAGGTVSLESDTSGFLAAAKVSTGTVGTTPNAGAAFNGAGVNSPLFEQGVSVGAGSFSVNGVQIDVAANDSINSVLAKITGSAAGVTATYDAASETVQLKTKSSTTTPIALGPDTSGFLSAVKLDGTAAATVEGARVSSFDASLGSMAEYSGVQAGTLTVNGHQVAVDPSTTTLRGLVNTLNGFSDVTATLDETTGKVQITSDQGKLTISDTSGALSALSVQAGTYEPAVTTTDTTSTQTGTVKVTNAQDVSAKVSDAIDKLNDVLADIGKNRDDDTKFQHDITNALQSAVEALRDKGVRGLSVSDDGKLNVSVSRAELASALQVLDEGVNLSATVASPLDKLKTDVTAAAQWDAPPPLAVQTLSLDSVRAKLTADQTATSLMLSTTKHVNSPTVVAKTASAAYTKG